MGRKLFLRHFEFLSPKPPASVSRLCLSDEGELSFRFHYGNTQQHVCSLKLLASDLDEYPDGNTWFLFTDDDNADQVITKSFDVITPLLFGKAAADAISEVVHALTTATTHGQSANPINIDSDEVQLEEEETEDEFFDDYEADDDDFGFGDLQNTTAHDRTTSMPRLPQASMSSKVDIKKIKADLLSVKHAGFRVGVIGDLTSGGIVCVSIRVSRLGISEEAMQAWGLKRSHYLLLMIRFLHGYRDATQVREDTCLSDLTEMRVALCNQYKPSAGEALVAFGQTLNTVGSTIPTTAALEPLFIGTPLNELLRDRFSKIIKYRDSCAFNWPSAEAFVYEIQGKAMSTVNEVDIEEFYLPPDDDGKHLVPIVKADAMDGHILKDVSLPLLAMQFTLRHFVRCTEFCLVCHNKVNDTFEALKPYVCSGDLCLYQYMALGFGPSIEWELLSQPYVVDLLISFCYVAAKHTRLKQFPVGIGLKVPLLPCFSNELMSLAPRHGGYSTQTAKTPPTQATPTFIAKFNSVKHQLRVEPDQQEKAKTLRTGDWVVVQSKETSCDYHYRVEGKTLSSISLGPPIIMKPRDYTAETQAYGSTQPATPSETRPSTPSTWNQPGWVDVECYCYEKQFSELEDNHKLHAITTLLDTLPSVADMQQYLRAQQKTQDPTLKTWRTRISESALNLLRWIIASNRSCIMQVDTCIGDVLSATNTTSEDRVSGLDNWMQFKFAMGAPDKEQRFVDSVTKETGGEQYPTFFAWHGSPISNWHSIIRQGLRFEETLHGRAYGNGVYMARDLATSMGYTGQGSVQQTWPQSLLKVSMAVSLQEVVNAPSKFVSKSPFYVVADIDWVQTRYLFVRSHLNFNTSKAPTIEYVQDPAMGAHSDRGQAIRIPITAVSKARRPATGQKSTKNGEKKSKQTINTDQATAEQQEDDANSVVSDSEDTAWLSSADMDGTDGNDGDVYEVSAGSVKRKFPLSRRKRGVDSRETDFEPGALDVSNIRFLKPPQDASGSATKALMAWYKDALKVQNSTPLHMLGWYIDPHHVSNMYQWIVELHSFDAKLPLAQDMKASGVTSVVVEIRFTNQFPFAPPFIRVVKPRFLPFNSGGGGHVTEGGAICMELLTNSGWSVANSFEMVMLQVRLAMSEEERPARLLYRGGTGKSSMSSGQRGGSYAVGEAVAAYERACRAHGWQVPAGFSQFAAGGEAADY